MSDCPFCKRVASGDYETGFYEFGTLAAVAFRPLNPVTEGHRLYVSAAHVVNAAEDPRLAGFVAANAVHHSREFYGISSFNLITSVGAAATQTVMHLHVHVVPRRPGDGLALPWTSQSLLPAP